MPLSLTRDSVPTLPRGVRLKHDEVRDRTILIAPERTLVLDGTSLAIIEMVDGQATVESIAQSLAKKYDAPLNTIGNDVVAFLKDLVNRGHLDVKNDGT